MEYALTHPPSSPATLERRRASRERRRLERQRHVAAGDAAAEAIVTARIAVEAARTANVEAVEAAETARVAREAADAQRTEVPDTANDAERQLQSSTNEE